MGRGVSSPAGALLSSRLNRKGIMIRFTMLSSLLFFAVAIVTAPLAPPEPAAVESGSPLEPGRVYRRADIPAPWTYNFRESRIIRSRSFRASLAKLGPYQGMISPARVGGERFLFVINGPATVLPGDSRVVLHDGGCMRLADGERFLYFTGEDSAEILDISVTGTDTPSGAVPEFPLTVASGVEIPKGSAPMIELSPGAFCRTVQGGRGQLTLLSLRPGGRVSEPAAAGEMIFLVHEGKMLLSLGAETVRLESGDILRLEAGTGYSVFSDGSGCEAAVFSAPGSPRFSEAAHGPKVERYRSIVPRGVRPEPVVEGLDLEYPVLCTEGASWLDGKLWFTSQSGTGVYAAAPGGGVEAFCRNTRFIGTAPLPNGNLAVCNRSLRTVSEITPRGEVVRHLAEPSPELFSGTPNDLVADSRGGVYVSVNDFSGRRKNNYILYIPPSGAPRKVLEAGEIFIPNGLALSGDGGRLFINDDTVTVWVAEVEGDGGLSGLRPFARLFLPLTEQTRKTPKSASDGMKLDRAGNLYVCAGQTGVQVFGPDGAFTGIINVPGNAYSCAFGGEDRSILYVACGSGVCVLRTETRGVPVPPER